MPRVVILLAAVLALHHPWATRAQDTPTVAQVGWMAGCWEPAAGPRLNRGAVDAAAEFTSTAVSDSAVTFENPAHDFPQRIIYRRRGADSLIARVEGMRGGHLRGRDFAHRRVPCP